jgi:hypothetical protein
MRRLCLVLALLLLVAGCQAIGLGGGSHQVKYEVTGTATIVDVTYQNENGDASQLSKRLVPWSTTVTVGSGGFAYVSAQNAGESGDVTCTIYVDGTQKESNTSSGAFTICTASGTL